MTEVAEKRNWRLVLKVVLVSCALSNWSSANASGGEAPQKRDQISIAKPLMRLNEESLNAGLAWLYAIPKENLSKINNKTIVRLLNKESKLTDEERTELWKAVSRYVEKKQLNSKKLELDAAKKLKDPLKLSTESTRLLQRNGKTHEFAKFKDSGYERNILRELAISIEPKLKYLDKSDWVKQTSPFTDAPGALSGREPPKFPPEEPYTPKSDQSPSSDFEVLGNRFKGTVDSLGFPEVVYLETKNLDGNDTSCTGTLLSNKWLLTADHCIYKAPKEGTFKKMEVSLHQTLQNTLQKSCKDCPVKTQVIKFCRHEWNVNSQSSKEDWRRYDVALLERKDPLLREDQPKKHYPGNIKFAMLGSPGADGSWASIASFGMNDDDKKEGTNDTLDVGPVRLNISRPASPPGLVSWDYLNENTPKETETRSCLGDSGTPFFSYDSHRSPFEFPRGYKDEPRVLIGIVSAVILSPKASDQCTPYSKGEGPLIADLKDWICNVIPDAKNEIRGCEKTPAIKQTPYCFDSE